MSAKNSKGSTKSKRSSSKSRTAKKVAVVSDTPAGKFGEVQNRVHIDETNRPDDKCAVVGRPAQIVKGDEQGTVGFIKEVKSYKEGGLYDKVIFSVKNSTRLVEVNYSDVDPLEEGFGAR